ncbi:MAG: hypothetical protein COA99_19700, partial [Moraxellaceae bacterium]
MNDEMRPYVLKRTWFQWVVGIPLLLLSFIIIFSASPDAVFYQGMNGPDLLIEAAGVAGYYFPGVALLIFSLFVLRRSKRKKKHIA